MAEATKTPKASKQSQVEFVESSPETERAAALQRGIPEAQLPELQKNTVWVVSNREDDVVVLWEQDPHHPGGEAFIGGSAPDHVYKTAAVQRAIYDQTAREVPPPARVITHPLTGEPYISPLYLMNNPERSAVPRGLPGQPIRLGRTLDPQFYDQDAIDAFEKQGQGGRQEIASEATVPSDNPNERRT